MHLRVLWFIRDSLMSIPSYTYIQMKNKLTTNDFCSIEQIPGIQARAAFMVDSSAVFREEGDIVPIMIDEELSYMPWGSDNQLPYRVLDLIEKDETLSTCQMFNSEVCYGSGLVYNCDNATREVRDAVDEFFLDNNMSSYFLGVSQDFKHFAFCVSVIILDKEGKHIVRLIRKEAMYCRFTPADKSGRISHVLYGNWRESICSREDIEVIPLLDPASPWTDLQERLKSGSKCNKYAIVTQVPTADHTYYPIPYYASLFRGKWYNIKQLIGMAKEAKLKNSAPIKYHIEISNKYWESIFKAEAITDRRKQQKRVVEEKQKILDFLTGAENSGKAWFSTFYLNPNGDVVHDVVITKIESAKEGGDWESDIQEAVNMMCFTMRVHSNLVGSVPGKAQSNNSGSDKRELYTIAQALQKPYHDLLFLPHRIICRFNGWQGVYPECPFIMLTTLDEHQDAKKVTVDPAPSA